MNLNPDKQGNQHRSYDDICAYLAGRHPIEHFSIIDNIHQHQQSGRDNKHFTNMQVGQGNGFNRAVMTETDDKLLKQFFGEQKQEIEDNGFSRRVIRQLPEHAKWMSDVLTTVCTVLCCILFYVFDGFNFLFGVIVEVITSQSYNLMSNTNFISLAIATVVVIIIGVQRVVSFR